MEDVMSDVRGILSGDSQEPSPRGTYESRMKDPADEAYTLLQEWKELQKHLEKDISSVVRSFQQGAKRAEMAKRQYGGGSLAALDIIEGSPLQSLRKLHQTVGKAVHMAESVVKEGRRGRGSLGRRESEDIPSTGDSINDQFDRHVDTENDGLSEASLSGEKAKKLVKPSKHDSKTITKLRNIVKDHQFAKVDGMTVDVTTASIVLQVFERLSEKNQKKMANLPIRKMISIAFSVLK